MARTPLFRLVRRSLRLARASLASGLPSAEVVDLSHQPWEVTRRELLGASAVVAAGAALGACRTASPPGPRRIPVPAEPGTGGGVGVLIVGAGIAGLSAGYRLRQAGVPVRILEAQDRTGGRMFSLRDHFADGQVVELGGELIDTGHTHIRNLAGELGIALDDLATDDPSLARDVWFFEGQRLTEAEVVDAFRPLAARIQADLATLGGDWISHDEPNGGETLDQMTLAAWLDAAGATGWMRQLLDVAYTTEYGLEVAEQSALNLLLLIDPNPDPFRIFGDSDERFHVRGGNDAIPAALAGRLADSIETGVRLEAVDRAADGSLRCSVRRGASSETIRADHLLLALPFTLLREVRLDLELPPVQRRAIRELGYGTNAKLMVGFADRIWRSAHGSNGSIVTDLPFQLTWETSRLQPGKAGVLVNFTGGRHGVELGSGDAAHQAALFVADLEKVFPGVAARRAGMAEVRMHWPSFPWTRGSYASYRPGQWTGFGGTEGQRVGPLHFAGEHCSVEAQGFMEGGCETGERAAAEILVDLGLAKVARFPGGSRTASPLSRGLAARLELARSRRARSAAAGR